MNRTSLLYLLIVSIVGCGIFGVLQIGNRLTPPAGAPAHHAAAEVQATPGGTAPASMFTTVGEGLRQNANDPLSRLFLQLLVIIAASRLGGWVFMRCGQPAVVGEMVAGILLGPSLFGLIFPNAFQYVFLPSSLGALKLFSQIGVCLFMFCVGMELDIAQVRQKAHTAVVVSHASIIIPYFLGVVLALFLYSSYAQPGASFTAFGLFMGISMSITAFPVLARIMQERGLSRDLLGTTAITCAAVDDVTAWCILAFVVAVGRATNVAAAAFNLVLVILFVGLMLLAIKPTLLRLLGRSELERADPGKGVLALIVSVVLAAAFCTELIGIHALFGAFLAGTIMPTAGDFREKLAVRVENFSSVLLLPLFFAFTGLRTRIDLLNDATGWLICVVVVAVATLGKLGGSAVTARITGMPWRESFQLGALMNTRGLMELIALNLGYDLGILSAHIFTMLVMMALVTTAMTGPLLSFFTAKNQAPAMRPEPSPS